MPTYPLPCRNPACHCATPAQALFCPVGHMTECHYPYDCRTAGCSHLTRYDYSPEEVAQFDRVACQAIRLGQQPPYAFDATGQVVVGGEHLPPAEDDEPTVTDTAGGAESPGGDS